MRKIILLVLFILISLLGNCEKIYESTDVTSEMMDRIAETSIRICIHYIASIKNR